MKRQITDSISENLTDWDLESIKIFVKFTEILSYSISKRHMYNIYKKILSSLRKCGKYIFTVLIQNKSLK